MPSRGALDTSVLPACRLGDRPTAGVIVSGSTVVKLSAVSTYRRSQTAARSHRQTRSPQSPGLQQPGEVRVGPLHGVASITCTVPVETCVVAGGHEPHQKAVRQRCHDRDRRLLRWQRNSLRFVERWMSPW